MKTFLNAWRTMMRMMNDSAFAEKVVGIDLLEAPAATLSEERKAGPKRSEALTLLETLQREARFIDFMMESLEDYSDAQIGAASRDVHRDSKKVLQRLFELKALRSEAEGSVIEVPVGYDPAEFRMMGKVAGDAPYRGTLQHAGWTAEKCELPLWSGRNESASVLAPAEIELS